MNLKTAYRILGGILTALLAGCASHLAAPATSVAPTSTPIKHVVVIYQENVSFDHYFATYPAAANPAGQPVFKAATGTPVANTLATPLDVTKNFIPLTGVDLLNNSPTKNNAANAANAINPFRLDRTQAATQSQNHDYGAEQLAFDNGKMDRFPSTVGQAGHASGSSPLNTAGVVMGYYDGNTVTAYWNYAQKFAMNDNSYGTNFGPSTVGAINLISGQTNGVIATNAATKAGNFNGSDIGDISGDGQGGITITGDPQPLGDFCSTRDAVTLSGKNIGDLLNAANVSWGFFEGGFDLTITNPNGSTGCLRKSASSVTGALKVDYIPHHEPFQYYQSTQNLTHARPSSVSAIGNTYQADSKTLDPANHQYDIHDFFDAVSAGNFPAVSFLKAPGYQDGHAGYSSPLDEQTFVTQVVNFLQQQPGWSSTLVIIAYDDSDGWYDHQASPILNPSMLTQALANIPGSNAAVAGVAITGNVDTLNGNVSSATVDPGTGHVNNPSGACNAGLQQGKATPSVALSTASGTPNAQGRCGYGPRLPFIVISPYAKVNYVDHTLTDQTSIMRFIEDNWLSGQRITGSFDSIAGPITNMLNFITGDSTPPLYLDPSSGQPIP